MAAGAGARLANVQIWHPGAASDADRAAYWGDEGEGGRLASLYGELLGMRRVDVGYEKLVHDDGRWPEIGFEDGREDRRAAWPDPRFPQQGHLDIEVGDLAAAESVARRWGATPAGADGGHAIWIDPVGHPFCLYAAADLARLPGRLARVVFDCPSPRDLAGFWAELLAMPVRVEDTPDRVVIAGAGAGTDAGAALPMLGFQRSDAPPPRWPDPEHPAQVHLDVALDGDLAFGQALLERLGARLLRRTPYHWVWADPADHPFCAGGVGG
jgi:hypothetical protein